MITVGTFEAKTHLARLLERVANGETVTITRRGVPIAKLVPVADAAPRREVSEVIEDLIRFRDRHPLSDQSIREMIDEGRRF